jgi:hypothetical protein
VSIAWGNVRLRANPSYRAVAWNRLSPEAGQASARDEESYGVLIPRDGGDLPLVAIDRDTALLFLSLQEAGPAPDFMFAMDEGEADRILRRLLFDSVLELEQTDRFVSGVEAYVSLGIEWQARSGGLARLSIDALRYGAALAEADVTTLAYKLYSYNRRPKSSARRRLLPDRAACLAFLRLGSDLDARNAIDALWSRSEDNSPWLVFRRRQLQRKRVEQSFKLYVGVAFEELPDCLPSLVRELGCSEALQFKIGADLDGLLRPDKLIAYFPSKDALLTAAQALQPVVAKLTVHAVPFSAEIAGAGTLSWGIDPTNASDANRLSWRQWICEKLADALTSARGRVAGDVTPWQFALERLRVEGIDTNTFMPTGSWPGAS